MRSLTAILVVMMTCVKLGYAQQSSRVEKPTTNVPSSEPIIGPTSVAGFQHGNQTYRIWESIYNRKDKPRLWQFRYDPQFRPEVLRDGSLNVTTHELLGGRWKIRLPIWVDTPEAGRLAYDSLKRAYPVEASEIQPESVQVLPIRTITDFKIEGSGSDIEINKGIITKQVPFAGNPTKFNFEIEAADKLTAEKYASILPESRLVYSMGFFTRVAKQNVVQLKMVALKKTSLYEKLKGLGTNDVYVHRDSLRKLIENTHRQVDIEGVIEVPEKYDEAVYRTMITDWSKQMTIEIDRFDQIKDALYDKKDLDPSEISKTLNQEFTKNQGEEEWKHSVAGKAGGSILGVISADAQASYSDEGLKKFLNEHGIHVSFEGRRIVPKSLDLQHINTGDFDNESKISTATLFVTGGLDKKELGTIDLNIESAHGYPNLPTQLAKLASQLDRLEEKTNRLTDTVSNMELAISKLGFTHETFFITIFTQSPGNNGVFVAADGSKPINAGGHIEYFIPSPERTFGKEVLATWYEPYETLASHPSFYLIDVFPAKNQIKIGLRAKVQTAPQDMTIKIHVIYR